MDKTLKTLHLRLDSTSKSLTKNALSQLIIKILFKDDKSKSINEIQSELKIIFKTDISLERIEFSLSKLVELDEISLKSKLYKLSRSNRRILGKRYEETKQRLDRIIKKHFEPYHSEKSQIIEWFSDATIEFFKSYSLEWVSDLSYTKSEKLKTKKEDIFKHIERRTKNNKNIDKQDVSDLIKKFIESIVNKKDADLDAHLWEYGTSAFAANLLQSSIGADMISLSAFSNSKCILDTNVLINISLDASEYHQAFKKLDKIFTKLNLTTGYYKITENEYVNTISHLNSEVIRSVSKFDFSVIKETDNDFIQSAIIRQCHLPEHFQSFCTQISFPPKFIDERQELIVFNDDLKLDAEIEKAQNDEIRKGKLNQIYKKVTGKDKKIAALNHDIGLIAGTEYLRRNEKAFIISQEVSINKYSHSKPHIENLPLSIKLETLINMLAIDNGGTDVNPNDFSNLFADMIRFNLQPKAETFEIADLSRLLDMEIQIEQLPTEEVINLANKVHTDISNGLNDDEISLNLNREFQDIKLKFVDDYTTAKEELGYEKREKEKHKLYASKTEIALRKRIKSEEYKRYDREVLISRIIWFLVLPLSITLLTILGIYFFNKSNQQTNFQSYSFGIISNVAFWIFTSLIIIKPKLKRFNNSKKDELDNLIEKRFNNEIQ